MDLKGLNIGLCYDSSIRNNGTPVLCWDSLKRGMGLNITRYLPQGELPKHDFYIYIDDGRDGLEWECPKPNAYWAVDTHLGYDYRLFKAKQFDYVFCAQQEGVEKMKRDGIENCYWLPLACHPPAHPNMVEMMQSEELSKIGGRDGLSKQYDIGFVGFVNDATGLGMNNRLEHLHRLFGEFTNSWLTANVFFEDMAVRYIRARLGFNVSIRNDLNMRFFEIPSIGTCMLTNRDQVGWDEIGFEEGKHFLGFQGFDEMIEKAQWGLDHPDEREQIAKAGMEEVRTNHTYVHRMESLLETCGFTKE